jgi:hypothetical protein
VEESTAKSAGATSAVSVVAGAAATSSTTAAAAAANGKGFSGEWIHCFLVLFFAGVDGVALFLLAIFPSSISL